MTAIITAVGVIITRINTVAPPFGGLKPRGTVNSLQTIDNGDALPYTLCDQQKAYGDFNHPAIRVSPCARLLF